MPGYKWSRFVFDRPHCAPCNTFGEQREIYEWIGLFFKPPWKQKSKICLLHSKTECPIHSKTAFFNRPIQGGLAHQKCYARVQPGHSVLWFVVFINICRYMHIQIMTISAKQFSVYFVYNSPLMCFSPIQRWLHQLRQSIYRGTYVLLLALGVTELIVSVSLKR